MELAAERKAPMTKSQCPIKPQAPMTKYSVWDFGNWDLFGHWTLGFGIFNKLLEFLYRTGYNIPVTKIYIL